MAAYQPQNTNGYAEQAPPENALNAGVPSVITHVSFQTSGHPTSAGLDAVVLTELNWWTTEDDLRAITSSLGLNLGVASVTFSEHKVNGKSKGLVHIVCGSQEQAQKLKEYFDTNAFQGRAITAHLTASAAGNPFRTLPKDPPNRHSAANSTRLQQGHHTQQHHIPMQLQNNSQHPRYSQSKSNLTKHNPNFVHYYDSPTLYDGSPHFKLTDYGSNDAVSSTGYGLFAMSGVPGNIVGNEVSHETT